MQPRHSGHFALYTPTSLIVFLVLFYAPFIAIALHSHGWIEGAAFGGGFLLGAVWFAVGLGIAGITAPRFAKLKEALEVVVYGLPLLGMPTLFLWDVSATLWRITH